MKEYTVLIHAALEAIALHLEALREEGQVPGEDPVIGTIKVAI